MAMGSLRLAMDAAFWDVEVSSAFTLDGRAKAIPGEPSPVAGARASTALRPQQLAFLGRGFPLGIIPSFSPPSMPHLGSFSLQTVIPGPRTRDWWTSFIAQLRPKTIISSLKAEIKALEEWDMLVAQDIAKRCLDKSLYALGFFSQFSLTRDTSILFNLEGHGERSERRAKAAVIHSLPEHEIILEAGWSELFLDRKGTYWNVPLSLSLDVASAYSISGLRYRFGLHKNDGQPHALNSSTTRIPSTLLPGFCAKAAFSYEKSIDLWRERVKKEEVEEKPAWLLPYDDRLSEPHSAISAIIGGTYGASFGGNRNLPSSLTPDKSNERGTQPVASSGIRKSANLFGSLCFTYQHGKFENEFKDLTRVDAHIDVPSLFKGNTHQEASLLSSPTFSVILQQQVVGPIVFRVDSKFSFNSPSGEHTPHVEDIIFGISYSLRALKSGKVLAWYSPKRKEAMVDLRLFEF